MTTSVRFRKPLEPMRLKKLWLKNRIVKRWPRLGFIDKEGHVTQQDLDLYEALAKGGAGLIVVDNAFVDPVGAKIRQASIADDKYIPSLAKLATVMHTARLSRIASDKPCWSGPRHQSLGGSSAPGPVRINPRRHHRYLGRQIRCLGVKLVLGQEFTLTVAEKIKTDMVILTAGASSFTPDLPGITNRKVMSAYKLHRLAKIFIRLFGPNILGLLSILWLPIGKRVVVIGGAIHGCETAEFLAKRGRKVIIVEESSQLGAGSKFAPHEASRLALCDGSYCFYRC